MESWLSRPELQLLIRQKSHLSHVGTFTGHSVKAEGSEVTLLVRKAWSDVAGSTWKLLRQGLRVAVAQPSKTALRETTQALLGGRRGRRVQVWPLCPGATPQLLGLAELLQRACQERV